MNLRSRCSEEGTIWLLLQAQEGCVLRLLNK